MTPAPRDSRRSQPRFDRFLKFVTGADGESRSLRELQEEAQHQGLSLAKLDAGVSRILKAAAAESTAPAWLERARAKRSWFEGQVRQRTQELANRYKDSKELMAAILSGELGAGVQARAGVFVRNRDAQDLSAEDLRSFVEDCELLESMPEDLTGELSPEPEKPRRK